MSREPVVSGAALASLDPERRRRLFAAKLRALVRTLAGEAVAAGARDVPFGPGAGLVAGAEGWVLAVDRAERSLGPALLWARRHGVARLAVLVDDSAEEGTAGVLARRAGLFADPPVVLAVAGSAAHVAVPARPMVFPELDPAVAAMAERIRAAGADPVPDDGTLVAEVNGLEVARVEVDADGPWLDVGVGRNDRLAHRMLHGGHPEPALARVVAEVAAHRRPGAPGHPLNRMARERWLRHEVIARPSLVGARRLTALPSPLRRRDLRDPVPAPAHGDDDEGRPIVVVCSTGVDPDLVPVAADVRLAVAPDARLVLVVPEGDAHPATWALAAALRDPAEVVALRPPWAPTGSAPAGSPGPATGPPSTSL